MVSLWTKASWEINDENKSLGSVTLGDGPNNDSFGRMRVSNPVTLFQSTMEVDDQPLLWDNQTTGTGAASYVANNSSVSLTTGGASSSALRQSHQYVRYQPGKSLLVLFSFVLGDHTTDTTKRIGLFDANNGVFLEQDGDEVYWVLRSYTGGVATETRVAQSDWNIPQTAFVLDSTKSNIGIIDLEWLGVGRVRCGFVYDGRIVYTHEFLYANRDGDTVYMTRASLPIRYEIVSGGEGIAAELVQICSTVISEGGFEPKGMIRAFGNGITTRSVSNTVQLPLLAIRLRSAYNKAELVPLRMDMLSSDSVYYEIRVRATVTGGSWSQVSEAVEANTTATAVSGGYVVSSGYVDKRASVVSSELGDSVLTNASDIGGTADIIVISAQSLLGTVSTGAALQWREIF